MRVLTVRQPWAWAIIHGGKDVENRVRNIAGAYRGPVAIHAGLATDLVGLHSDLVDRAWKQHHEKTPYPPAFPGKDRKHDSVYLEYGAIIGVVDLVDVHTADDTEQTRHLKGLWPVCSRWADRVGHHLVLANPRPLTAPIPFKGALGLRTLPADVEATIRGQVK